MLQGITLICVAYMAYTDWQHKSVPLWILVFVGALSAYAGYPQLFELKWWLLAMFILAGLALFAYLYYKQYQKPPLGFADWLLLPTMLVWFPADKIPVYLILTGISGIFLAYLWRWLYQEAAYPFAPCLIISWVLMILT